MSMGNYRISTSTIEVVNGCNLKCEHCYSKFEHYDIMKIEIFKKIVDELYIMGCLWFTVTGGEPTLLGNKLYTYLMYIKSKRNTNVVLTTNGTMLLDESLSPDLIDVLQISIDGDEQMHDTIRGAGSYKKTIDFLRRYSSHYKMTIMMTLHDKNIQYLSEVHQIALEYNTVFGVEVMSPCGRGENLNPLNSIQLQNLFIYLKNYNISCSDPRFLVYSHYERIDESYLNLILTGCSAGNSVISFDCFGNILPCARARDNLDNIRSVSLKEVWNTNTKLNLLRKRDINGICRKCKYLKVCGSCRANYDDIYNGGENECWLFKEIKSY